MPFHTAEELRKRSKESASRRTTARSLSDAINKRSKKKRS